MITRIYLVLFTALFLPTLFYSKASHALNINDDLVLVQSGVISCGGGRGISFRNINTSGINLEVVKLIFLDRNGAIFYNSSTHGFPAGFSNVLGPTQSSSLDPADAVALSGMTGAGGPVQVRILFRNRNSTTNLIQAGLPPRIGVWATKNDSASGISGVHSVGCRYVSAQKAQ